MRGSEKRRNSESREEMEGETVKEERAETRERVRGEVETE